MARKVTSQKGRAPSPAQLRRRKVRAQASIAGALKCAHSPDAIDGALGAVVARLAPDYETGEELHERHVKAREAFTRFLRRRGCR